MARLALLFTYTLHIPDGDISIFDAFHYSCAVSLHCLCVHPNHLGQCIQGNIPDIVVPEHHQKLLLHQSLKVAPKTGI